MAQEKNPPVAVPWEGPSTFVRPTVTRGSASGSALADNPAHRMSGYNAKMEPLTACGLTLKDDYRMFTRLGDERRCPDCRGGPCDSERQPFAQHRS